MQQAGAVADEKATWDRHWRGLQGESATFGRLASLVRRTILQRAVRRSGARWFPASGVLVETGCGSGEASATLAVEGRRLVGLDFSLAVLLAGRRAGAYHWRLAADLRHLPFADGTIHGTWNLGVMEHFPAGEGVAILRELRRVLAPEGIALLYWPPIFGLSRLVLAPFEALRSALARRRFRFFPDEVNLLRSRRQGRAALAAAGLEPVAAEFNFRDAFIHVVLVGRKPR